MRISQSFEEFMGKLQARLHPHHFMQIKPADAQKWWESLDSDTEHDEIWHMNRLGNQNGPTIGGSEIGALVAAELKEPAPFDLTPSVLFSRKTLELPLEPTNPAMLFGNRYEQVARSLFEQEYEVTRDHAAIDALAEANRSGKIQTLAYSPDDIFLLPDGTRVLPDYKSPFTGLIPDPDAAPLGYVSQLHQGKLVLEELGFKVDHLMLVYLSHPKSLARPKAASITVIPIDHDPLISEIIVRRSVLFNENVMTGDNPGHVWLSAEKRQELAEMDAELVQLRRDMEAMEIRRRVIEQSMSEVVADLTKSQLAEIQLNMTPVTRLSVTSEEDVSLYLENQDVFIDEYKTAGTIINTEAVWAAFEALAKNKNMSLDKKDFINPDIKLSDLDEELLFAAFSVMAEGAGQPVEKTYFLKRVLDVPAIAERYPELVGLGVVKKSLSWSAPRAEPKPKKKKGSVEFAEPVKDGALPSTSEMAC